jgi:hypothetical protein
MKKALCFLCLLLVCWIQVGMSTQFSVVANPLEPHGTPVVLLTPQNKSRPLGPISIWLGASHGYPLSCSLILHEVSLDNFNLTMKIEGVALFWQDENIETWLTVDNQTSVKLNRSELHIGSAALLGGIFESKYDLTLSGLSEGCHIIKIEVFQLQTWWEGNVSDFYGTDKLDHYQESIIFRIDTTNPFIGDISIKDATYFRNDLELNFTINEPFSWIAYSLDNQANVTIKTNIDSDYAFNNTTNKPVQVNTMLAGLTEGSHTLTIHATDTAGNTGVSQTITFTIVKLEPLILIAALLIGVAIVGVGLLVYFKKCKH